MDPALALSSSSVFPTNDTHRFANSTGEYQRPPSAKITPPLTSTATLFTTGKVIGQAPEVRLRRTSERERSTGLLVSTDLRPDSYPCHRFDMPAVTWTAPRSSATTRTGCPPPSSATPRSPCSSTRTRIWLLGSLVGR